MLISPILTDLLMFIRNIKEKRERKRTKEANRKNKEQ